jgi:glycosyltransferase involved in cell wall biosynthesis
VRKNKPLFSVITATHNRSHYLKTLYGSLVSQSFKNIEWIIGNDGSTDKSDILINSFIKDNKLKIKYIKSNLRIGKSKIDNLIIPKASGKYMCYCGSDDYFKKDAFKNMFKLLNRIPLKLQNKINGVLTVSVDENGISQSSFNNKISKDEIFISWEKFTSTINGDVTNLEKTSAYKNKKFKEVDFLISESTLINKIHKKKIFLLSPIVTKVMRRAEDSISYGSSMKYCRGYAYSISINQNTRTFNKLRLIKRIWFFINYWRYIYHGDINFLKGKKMWVVTKKLSFYYLLIPLSIFLCIRDIVWKKIEKTHLEFEKNKKRAKIKYVK